jgi:hypothetical protein
MKYTTDRIIELILIRTIRLNTFKRLGVSKSGRVGCFKTVKY